MEDSKIIQLFWERDESAISAVSEKYGRYCATIARNIIGNEQSVEECVNDTLLELWEVIPPNHPKHFLAFISKVVRNNALDAVKGIKAQKRGMRQYLLDLKAQGKTILIASHSAEDIDVLCDTVCEMNKGELSIVR